MVPAHALLHVPVVSVSGQAVLTMPVMAPLADLLGVSRDAAVIAYQTGAGLMDMITPANGALLAMLLRANVSYNRWPRFAIPGALLVSLVGFAGIWLSASRPPQPNVTRCTIWWRRCRWARAPAACVTGNHGGADSACVHMLLAQVVQLA
jgi:C4-dicarboxylate anaerobic carrier